MKNIEKIIGDWFARLWIRLKVSFHVENDEDLFKLLLSRLVSIEVREKITELVLEVATQPGSGAEKKALVMQKFQEVKRTLSSNALYFTKEALSSAVNIIVEDLQLKGTLGHGNK